MFCDDGGSAYIDGDPIDRMRFFAEFGYPLVDVRGDVKLAVDAMLEDLLFVESGLGWDRYGQVGRTDSIEHPP